MKKKLLTVVMSVIIALVAGFAMNQDKKELSLSDIMLNNVEALASGESSEDFYKRTGCIAVWYKSECKGKDGKTHTYAKAP